MGDPIFNAGGFREFLLRVRNQGLEWLGIYYGIYRAKVVDNSGPKDKQGQGIITVLVPSIGDTATTSPRTAYPMTGFAGGDYGSKLLPNSKDFVWVMFENGRVDMPVWTGGWWGKSELPPEFEKTTRNGIKTPGGHSILFSDDPDNRFVRITWHSDDSGSDEFAFLELTKDGGIAMSNKSGSSLFLSAENENILAVSEQGHSVSLTEDGISLTDKDGNIISIDKGDITVLSNGDATVSAQTVNLKSGSVFLGDPAVFSGVLGELLVEWLGTHIHGTGVGPSSPALQAPKLPIILSQSVKLKK